MPLIIVDTKVYNVEDLKEMLKVGTVTLQKMFRKKLLRGTKIGKHWYITEENLKAFLSGETYEQTPRKSSDKT